jgi:hypothetical protein
MKMIKNIITVGCYCNNQIGIHFFECGHFSGQMKSVLLHQYHYKYGQL